MSEPAIKEAMRAAHAYLMDDKAYQAYLAHESAIWDYNTDIKGAQKQGRAEGRAEGISEGQRHERAKWQAEAEKRARMLLQTGKFGPEDIALATGVPMERIRALSQKK